MKNAQLISRWKICEALANKLGMTIGTNHTDKLIVQGQHGEGFKGFHGCETVDELLGYLIGVSDAKTKAVDFDPVKIEYLKCV